MKRSNKTKNFIYGLFIHFFVEETVQNCSVHHRKTILYNIRYVFVIFEFGEIESKNYSTGITALPGHQTNYCTLQLTVDSVQIVLMTNDLVFCSQNRKIINIIVDLR